MIDGRRRGPLKFAYASGARPLDGYTIKRGIGAGGFGDVYYATSDAGKDVALKRIQRNLDVELRGVSQCLNLKHPNLVDLYDIRYDDQQQAWVVMEYVSGASLHDEIQRNPNGLSEEQMLRWLDGIINGVAYLHDHGIVHRDLKPGNIFMDHQTVKIGDYGLSKFISCSRRSGQTESVGTFHYMAPEIGLGRYGKEIDIYALGILLFEMLTGRVPFEGESSQEIIMKHLTTQPDLSRVPKRYRSIIARAMAKDPNERFRSAHEILDVLHGGKRGSAKVGNVPPFRPAPFYSQAGPAQSEVKGDQVNANAGNRDIQEFRDATFDAAQRAHHWARKDEEPVAAEVRKHLSAAHDKWSTLPGGVRFLLAIPITLIFLFNLPWLIGPVIVGCLIYSGYYVLWYLLFRVVDGPSVPGDAPNVVHRGLQDTAAAPEAMASFAQVAAAEPPELPKTEEPKSDEGTAERGRHKWRRARYRPKVATRQQVNDALRAAMQKKTFAQRGSELTGSMLMAAFVASVLSLFMAMMDTRDPSMAAATIWSPLFVWLTLTSVATSWAVLILSKGWESADGDQARRRFCMLAAGMAVGGFSYLLYQGLMLEPVYILAPWHELNNSLASEVMPSLYGANGDPHPLAFASYFGGLFLVLRWWMAADPIRSSRFGVWSTIVTIVMSILAYGVVPIPRGFMAIIASIVAVQLSATWVDTRRRRQLKEKLMVA